MPDSTVIGIPRKPYFRPDEVAEIFGVTKKTVYQWRYIGKIDGVHIAGGPLRFERTEIIRICKESETEE